MFVLRRHDTQHNSTRCRVLLCWMLWRLGWCFVKLNFLRMTYFYCIDNSVMICYKKKWSTSEIMFWASWLFDKLTISTSALCPHSVTWTFWTGRTSGRCRSASGKSRLSTIFPANAAAFRRSTSWPDSRPVFPFWKVTPGRILTSPSVLAFPFR